MERLKKERERDPKKGPKYLHRSQTEIRDGNLQSGAHVKVKWTERPKRGLKQNKEALHRV